MGIKVLVSNRKAFHDYMIGDKFEAGLSLTGTEIKSLRQGKANLTDGWVELTDSGPYLKDIHISHYSHGNLQNHDETRPRPLLLSKIEISKIRQKMEQKGFTVVPLKIYMKNRWAKCEIALAKGKKQYDKRESDKKKQADRDISRAMRGK
ncbi:SsrA-binding protein SmpB [Oligoflexaceae bacterium]|nr:SsrA-binding protein SmpB [Oligoflexaceae bacterium]